MSITAALLASAGIITPDVTREVILVQGAMLSPIYAYHEARGLTAETKAEDFSWTTDQHTARRTQINNGGAAYTNATTALVVDNAALFYPNCVVFCEATGETMFCTAVNTGTNTITVVRGFGAGVAAHANSVADDAYLRILGPATGELADPQAARSGLPTKITNTVQTMRHSVELSGRAQAVETLTEDEKARQQAKKFQELLQDINLTLRLGGRNTGTNDANSKRVTSSAGFRSAIASKVDSVGGTMTLARFHQYCEMAFEFTDGEKVMFCGGTLVRTIHDLYNAKLQIQSGTNAPGLRFSRVQTPFGELTLAYDQSMVGPEAGEGLTIDTGQSRIRYTKRGRPQYQQNIKQQGQDGTLDQWFAELGLEYGAEKYHSRLTGVTGAA